MGNRTYTLKATKKNEADNGSLALKSSYINTMTTQQLALSLSNSTNIYCCCTNTTAISHTAPSVQGCWIHKQQGRDSFEEARRFFSSFPLPPSPHFSTNCFPHLQVSSLGADPSLGIYKCKLPQPLLQLLNGVVSDCEQHASQSRMGWHTGIYSLTKQDISLQWLPETYKRIYPIIAYVKYVMSRVYYLRKELKLDSYQPHVLKYSCSADEQREMNKQQHHTGVQLHFDKCDYTANIMLSNRSSYNGGG